MTYNINRNLADRFGLTGDEIIAIEVVGNRLMDVLNDPEKYSTKPDEVLNIVRSLECSLQLLWGFDYNTDYWTYEFEINGCTCPVLDNMDRKGVPSKVYNYDCPYHGHKE